MSQEDSTLSIYDDKIKILSPDISSHIHSLKGKNLFLGDVFFPLDFRAVAKTLFSCLYGKREDAIKPLFDQTFGFYELYLYQLRNILKEENNYSEDCLDELRNWHEKWLDEIYFLTEDQFELTNVPQFNMFIKRGISYLDNVRSSIKFLESYDRIISLDKNKTRVNSLFDIVLEYGIDNVLSSPFNRKEASEVNRRALKRKEKLYIKDKFSAISNTLNLKDSLVIDSVSHNNVGLKNDTNC